MPNRLPYSLVKAKIEKLGGILLQDYYVNNKTPLKIKCTKCQYVMWKPLLAIRDEVCDCEHQEKKYLEVRRAVEATGNRLLSEVYIAKDVKLDVECKVCGLIWHPTYKEILDGHVCRCRKISKKQMAIFEILKSLYPDCIIHLNYKGFDWLKNPETKGCQEFDVFLECSEFALAVEYDGKQHFTPVCFGGISEEKALDRFNQQKARDKRKNRLVQAHKSEVKYFLRFNYREKITKELVIKKLKKIKCPI